MRADPCRCCPGKYSKASSDICTFCFVGKWTAQNGSASCIGCDAPSGHVCLAGPARREGVKCASHLMCPGGACGDMPVAGISVGSEWHNVCVLICIETLNIQTMRAYIHTHTHTSIYTYTIKIAAVESFSFVFLPNTSYHQNTYLLSPDICYTATNIWIRRSIWLTSPSHTHTHTQTHKLTLSYSTPPCPQHECSH
jgi:hypothetical protein